MMYEKSCGAERVNYVRMKCGVYENIFDNFFCYLSFFICWLFISGSFMSALTMSTNLGSFSSLCFLLLHHLGAVEM